MGIDLEKFKQKMHEFETVKDENGLTEQDKWFLKQERREVYKQYQVERIKRYIDDISYDCIDKFINRTDDYNNKLTNLINAVTNTLEDIGELYDVEDGFGCYIYKGFGYRSCMGSRPQFSKYKYYSKPTPIGYELNKHIHGGKGNGIVIKLGYENLPIDIQKFSGGDWVISPHVEDIKHCTMDGDTDVNVLTTHVINLYREYLKRKSEEINDKIERLKP